MLVKWSVLIVVTSLLWTALAMAFSGSDGEGSSTAKVINNTNFSATQKALEAPHHAKTDSSLDLSSIKRISPKPNKNSALFQSKSWYVAPPIPKPQLSDMPPVVPVAPQLSFTYSGRMIDGDQVILFLFKNGRQYSVKTGDVLDGIYRLDNISNVNAIFTYLPMSIQQTLTFNSTAIGALTTNEPQRGVSMQATLPLSNQFLQQ